MTKTKAYVDYLDNEEEKLDKAEIEKRIETLSERISLSGSFSITFVSDDYIKELNKNYRDKDEATDVLTFRFEDDDSFPSFEEEEKIAGDIFISSDSVLRNAETFSTPFIEELTRVALHGMLHLKGYDHESNDFSSEEMLIYQEKLLKELGYSS